ncbi:MAG: hypothetical protein CMB64_03515 [Euryarchaeota archaeon]|nr:hypothetical protein [Euryarchaeota archaeon]
MIVIEEKKACYKTDGTVRDIRQEIADIFSLDPFNLRFIDGGRQLNDEEYTEKAIVTERIHGGAFFLPAVILGKTVAFLTSKVVITKTVIAGTGFFAAVGLSGPVLGHVFMDKDLKNSRAEEMRHLKWEEQQNKEQKSKTEMSAKTAGFHKSEAALSRAEGKLTKSLIARSVVDGNIEIEDLTNTQIDLIAQADKLKLRDEYVEIWEKKGKRPTNPKYILALSIAIALMII